MTYFLLCFVVFVAAYSLNLFYISVLYHRGLTHGAVTLSPGARKFVAWTGNWITGLDPKGWACMHRMHHLYSDTPQDPHSPTYQGVFPLMLGQLRSYERILRGLLKGRDKETSIVSDLDFPVSWLNRHKLWYVPYLTQATTSVALGYFVGPLMGVAYYFGIMSHPIQGWMVNAFGHTYGYRNFETDDNSKNHAITAWLVAGEGYQNNHHHQPQSAKFSVKKGEWDAGYWMCLAAEKLGWLKIVPVKLPAEAVYTPTPSVSPSYS